MKRSPALLISLAPSPRSASVASGAGSRPTFEHGGVELDELGIADHRAGARRHGQPATGRLVGVGGDGVEVADAAGGEHHGARGKMQRRPVIASDAR